VPTTRRSRTIEAPPGELWRTVSDPHHLPRWWPRVTRVEDVRDDEFTEVMLTARGKVVRADFRIVRRYTAHPPGRGIVWEQLVDGTPFARVLGAAETEITLEPVQLATLVTIELRQTLSAREARSRMVPRLGSLMVARAAAATLDEALDGLERIGG
jgi:uncharacterized protein YndB with AHSA1/START domain